MCCFADCLNADAFVGTERAEALEEVEGSGENPVYPSAGMGFAGNRDKSP
jgi:hypothetical protein